MNQVTFLVSIHFQPGNEVRVLQDLLSRSRLQAAFEHDLQGYLNGLECLEGLEGSLKVRFVKTGINVRENKLGNNSESLRLFLKKFCTDVFGEIDRIERHYDPEVMLMEFALSRQHTPDQVPLVINRRDLGVGKFMYGVDELPEKAVLTRQAYLDTIIVERVKEQFKLLQDALRLANRVKKIGLGQALERACADQLPPAMMRELTKD